MKKSHSAIVSSLFSTLSREVRSDKKEKMQQAMRKSAAKPVNSSMSVLSFHVLTLIEVVITKQKPNKFEAVPKIC